MTNTCRRTLATSLNIAADVNAPRLNKRVCDVVETKEDDVPHLNNEQKEVSKSEAFNPGNMENNKILNPGESAHPNTHSEQIKEEFYKWFESRGLLAELRAYMRQLMVKALEENNSNGLKKWAKKSSSSPKLQAINLLVVDYLFHEDYFYTVSVFASEAHILDSLPQYSRYVTESVQQRRWNPSSLPRFSRQETEDILDTLHLPPSTSQLRQAVDSYLAGRESLLACVVRTLVPLPAQSCRTLQEEEMERETDSSHQLWSEEMQQLLLMAGLKLTHIHRMQHKWTQVLENERLQARKKAEEDLAAREAEWQLALEERLEEERADLQERQSRVEIREESLASLAEQLSAVHEDVNQRLSQLQIQSEQLDERALQQERERLQLQQHMREVKLCQVNMDHALPSQSESDLREEPVKIANEGLGPEQSTPNNPTTKEVFVQVTAEEELGTTVSTQTLNMVTTMSTQTLDLAVVASTQTIETQDHELQTSLDQPDPELLAQLDQARRKISEVQEENVELRAHILQQRQRIDELTNRAANLSSQLEETQIAVTVLRGRDSAVVTSATHPPAPPPMILAPTFGFQTPQRQGGGEESLFVPRHQQASPRVDGRRRPLRYAFSQQHPSPNSEESSPTDEVIQNARSRIQQLEQESISIQRNFQDFQTRLLTTDPLLFPPLRPLRTSDPVMRVRRSEIRPNLATERPYPHFSFDGMYRRVPNRQQYEEHEDSSSEHYDVVGMESMSNSRRLFSQRNIRHFERWKQFKKKFQKREGLNSNKCMHRALNSNTSSDDDDAAGIQSLRNQNKHKNKNNINTTLVVTSQVQQESNHQDKHNPKISEQNSFDNDEATNRETTSKDIEGQSKKIFIKKTQPKMSANNEDTVLKGALTVAGPSETDIGIELDLKRSAKLIESVKVLLDAQSIKESVATTVSNESLAVESLPRDSVSNSQIDIGKTDSSIVTVQIVNTRKEKEAENKVPNNNITTTPSSFNNQEARNIDLQESLSTNQNQHLYVINNSSLQENNTEKLRSAFPLPNIESEELWTSNLAGTSSDVAEVESVGRVTTSQTSGSDILRELNPSKTDSSSSSVISAGFGEDSKHSSDFWG